MIPYAMILQKLENACTKLQANLTLPPLAEELIHILYDGSESNEIVDGEFQECKRTLPFSASEVFYIPIKCHHKLTEGTDVKPVYEVVFNTEDKNLTFQAGDTIGILPQNSISETMALIKLLQLEDKVFQSYKINAKPNLSAANVKKFNILTKQIPLSGTLENLLKFRLNIRSIVKKIMLRSMSVYCSDEKDKKYMEILCSKEGGDLYKEFILNNALTVHDILLTFKSCKPPITLLIQNLPILMPRPYSICSSALLSRNELKICFNVQENEHGLKGVTTGWLELLIRNREQKSLTNLENQFTNLHVNQSTPFSNDVKHQSVPMYLRVPTAFRLPLDEDVSILMIGTGTGVSPFIGFLREKKMRRKKNPGLSTSKTYLFYGCRYKNSDFLFKNELFNFIEDGTLTKLAVAFSREDGEKAYVQDKLKIHAELIVEIIDSGGKIYICGNLVAMERAVRQSIEECIVQVKCYSFSEAKDLVSKLQADLRYVVDVWS